MLFETIQENPSIAAGICTFAVAFSLVAGNALYGQKSVHPVPLFATRDSITTKSVQKPDRAETRRQARRSSDIAQIPIPKARPQFTPQAANASTLVRDTQEGLRAIAHAERYLGERASFARHERGYDGAIGHRCENRGVREFRDVDDEGGRSRWTALIAIG